MTWIGIDPSLAGTAIAIIDDTGHITVDRIATQPTSTHGDTVARMNRIERWLRNHLERLGQLDLTIGIEGPAFSRSDGKSHERAGLWWRLYTRADLYTDTHPIVIGPTKLKKYATGRGNSDKDAVLLAVSRRYPSFPGRSNDEADALVLAAMLARHEGHAIEQFLPASHIEALRDITPGER